MNVNLSYLIYLFIFFVFSPSITSASNSYDEQQIKQRMMTFMKSHHIHGAAVIIARNGKMHTYLFGEAVPAKHIPVTENTIFELGSITKTFTGILLAENVMLGKTMLSEPINHYLDKPHSSRFGKVTYLNVATHSAGLPFNARNLPYNASTSSTHRFRFNLALRSKIPSCCIGNQ